MTLEEETARSQSMIESFARLAHAARLAAEALDEAFRELRDYPIYLGQIVPQLASFARSAADEATAWAQEGDADFDPAADARR